MARLSDALTSNGSTRPSTAPALFVERLTIRRGRAEILRELSWSHKAGHVAWIVGENGAGKSSLLRVIAGRAAPSAGRVRLVVRRPHAARTVYYHPDMRTPRHATLGEWRRWTRALLPKAGGPAPPRPLAPTDLAVEHRLDRLSTGQMKRLLLDVLLRQPADLVVLDEPFAHLSEDARHRLADALALRARDAIVVVATNRAVAAPGGAMAAVLAVDADAVVRTTPETAP